MTKPQSNERSSNQPQSKDEKVEIQKEEINADTKEDEKKLEPVALTEKCDPLFSRILLNANTLHAQ